MRLYTAVVDCTDLHAQVHWWADVLGWTIVHESDDEATIVPPHCPMDALEDREAFDRAPTGIVFVPVAEKKTVKNRLHLDFAPHESEDRDAIVERFLRAGATRVDVGQGDSTWEVLADPEGNEFCILSARTR